MSTVLPPGRDRLTRSACGVAATQARGGGGRVVVGAGGGGPAVGGALATAWSAIVPDVVAIAVPPLRGWPDPVGDVEQCSTGDQAKDEERNGIW